MDRNVIIHSPKYNSNNCPRPWDLQTKINIFEDRIKGWYLNCAKSLLQDENAGFGVLHILFSYFETYTMYKNGYVKSEGLKNSKRFFLEGIEDVFHQDFYDCRLSFNKDLIDLYIIPSEIDKSVFELWITNLGDKGQSLKCQFEKYYTHNKVRDKLIPIKFVHSQEELSAINDLLINKIGYNFIVESAKLLLYDEMRCGFYHRMTSGKNGFLLPSTEEIKYPNGITIFNHPIRIIINRNLFFDKILAHFNNYIAELNSNNINVQCLQSNFERAFNG